MSELVVNGKLSLDQIARMDDGQLVNIIFRRRDKWGALVRDYEDLPEGVHVNDDGMRVIKGKRQSFEKMFERVNQHLTPERRQAAWANYVEAQEAEHQRFLEERRKSRTTRGKRGRSRP